MLCNKPRILDLGILKRAGMKPLSTFTIDISSQHNNPFYTMTEPLGLDLASKRKRSRSDYVYLEDYRSRW